MATEPKRREFDHYSDVGDDAPPLEPDPPGEPARVDHWVVGVHYVGGPPEQKEGAQ